jgi:hypothetical protein
MKKQNKIPLVKGGQKMIDSALITLACIAGTMVLLIIALIANKI